MPDSKILKQLSLGVSSGLQIDEETVPAFLHLQEFAESWESKWHVNRDYYQSDNTAIREQYVGGDPDDLLRLHMEGLRDRAEKEGTHYEEEEGEDSHALLLAAGLINGTEALGDKLGHRFWNLLRSDKARRKAAQRRKAMAEKLLRDVEATNDATLRLEKWTERGGGGTPDLAYELSRHKQQGEHLVGSSSSDGGGVNGGIGKSIRDMIVGEPGSSREQYTPTLYEIRWTWHRCEYWSSRRVRPPSLPSLAVDLLSPVQVLQHRWRVPTEREWIDMANLLGSDLHEYADQCMTYDEFLLWLRHVVVAVRTARVRSRRRRRDVAGNPPTVAPIPLGIPQRLAGQRDARDKRGRRRVRGKGVLEQEDDLHDDTVFSSFVKEPTSNEYEARARLAAKLDNMDPLETGSISIVTAVHVCEWIWQQYYPEGVRLDDEELREARESLHAVILTNKANKEQGQGQEEVRGEALTDAQGFYLASDEIETCEVAEWFLTLQMTMISRRKNNISSAQLVYFHDGSRGEGVEFEEDVGRGFTPKDRIQLHAHIEQPRASSVSPEGMQRRG